MAAIQYEAGPDPSHLWADGWHSPLAGAITDVFPYRIQIRFENAKVVEVVSGGAGLSWYANWVVVDEMTLEEFLESTANIWSG